MVRWTASLITAVAISGLQVAVAAERKMPKFDIAAACRSSGAVETPAGCTRDEQAARDQLGKSWPRFKQSDRSRCVRMVTDLGPSMSSYVELLTCLQAAKIEKKMPADPLGPLPAISELANVPLRAVSPEKADDHCPLHSRPRRAVSWARPAWATDAPKESPPSPHVH
jgi:hypothetical protein